MMNNTRFSRRNFLRGLAATGAASSIFGGLAFQQAWADSGKSPVFRIDNCPVHDGQQRHIGLDALLQLLAGNGVKFYATSKSHPWGGAAGIIGRGDIVLIKVNCQWKCRGTTNTDLLRGLITRILQHPDGFTGEVVIIENGQGRGAFDGINPSAGSYTEAAIAGKIVVNAEQANLLSVDYLVNTVFKGQAVSAFLLDPIRGTTNLASGEHVKNGYRMVKPPSGSSSMNPVSYPCFTTPRGHRIELREGRWTGSGYAQNVKLINLPVLKDHGGTGMTGTLKHVYGILSMSDGQSGVRHYGEAGSQTGKMWSLVRVPDLNILDCIWVSHEQLRGYPESATRRCNVLLGGLDPVALDYHAARHVLLPLGGSQAAQHDPDSFSGLVSLLKGAQDFINANGGIHGVPTRQGDANIQLISASVSRSAAGAWRNYS